MKRKFEVIYPENHQDGYLPGDEAAHRAAAALADRADAPTIAALTDMLTFLERVGGQFHVTALRLASEVQEGEWDTQGIGFNFETRDARVMVAKAPEEINFGQLTGVPITDSQAPAVEVEVESGEPGTDELIEPASEPAPSEHQE